MTTPIETVRLSNRQFNMLAIVQRANHGVALKDAYRLDQRSLGSIAFRGLIEWSNRTNSFLLSATGRAALEAFHKTDVRRKNIKAPLGKHIQPRTPRKVTTTHATTRKAA